MVYPQFNPYFQNQQMYSGQNQMQQNQVQQPQVQNGGMIIGIPSEADARSYPLALGNSITFKDENAPYIYTKTMGFNQFEAPKFEKYRLVKEDDSPVEADKSVKVEDSTIDDLKGQIEAIRGDIEAIKKKIAPKTVKKIMKEIEVDEDDDT